MTTEVKKCLWCGREFVQPKPPKAVQSFCCYNCYLRALRVGVK